MHRRVPSARCSATRTAPGRTSVASFASLGDRSSSSLLEPSRPGRTSGPSLVVRRRSWGSSLRRFNPASGGHASLHSRAHMPFAPSHLTRLIFVGVITPARWHLHRTRKGEWVWGLRRSTSGLRSRLRSAPAVIVATGRDPALGFASCRVRGHAIRASARARPRLADHQPPALADHFGKSSQSAHGLWAILPGSSARRWLPPFCAKPVTALTATSPALQRVEGTDAWLVRTFVRIRTLFEVLHRP